MKTARVPIEKIAADPDNPRTMFDPDELIALGRNMLAHGQQVPVIVYPHEDVFRLADGERRWRAAKLSGITELTAMIHPQKPDDATLAMLQMSLEVHKVSLSPMERSNLLAKIREKTVLSLSDLGERLQMSQSLVSKLLSLQKLGPDIRAQLHTGKLDVEKAYLISGEPDVQKQVALLGEVAALSRDQIRARVRKKKAEQPKAKRAVFALPGGLCVTFQGAESTLEDIVERFLDLVKELKRGVSQGLDVKTQQSVMRDKAKTA
jgi:ParB family chromosome partitioning protein